LPACTLIPRLSLVLLSICHTVSSTLVPYLSLLVFLSLYRSIYLLIPFHFLLTIARPHASNVTHPIRSCPRLPSYLSHLSFIFCLPPTTCFSSTRALLYQVCSTKASTCIIFSSSFPVCAVVPHRLASPFSTLVPLRFRSLNSSRAKRCSRRVRRFTCSCKTSSAGAPEGDAEIEGESVETRGQRNP
jgi:hypothetical protein